ncbi:MAG: hypothetical protein R3C26_01730 [Calditrichia bacterium]
MTSQHNLPAGVRLFAGERSDPLLKTWYLEADLNQPDLIVRPYLGSLKRVSSFTQSVGAYGGQRRIFWRHKLCIYCGFIRKCWHRISRSSTATGNLRSRAAFSGFNDQFEPSVDWVFHLTEPSAGCIALARPPKFARLPCPATRFQRWHPISRDALIGIGGGS